MQSLIHITTGRCLRFKTSLPRRHSAISCYATMSEEDPIVQYVALRRDLWKEHKWPLGSIVAQGCHAATAALWISRDSDTTQLYCSPDTLDHMRKVLYCYHRVLWILRLSVCLFLCLLVSIVSSSFCFSSSSSSSRVVHDWIMYILAIAGSFGGHWRGPIT